MLVKLNEEKAPFCQIGSYYLTFGEPGPHDIDVDSLTEEQKKQLAYNVKRGVLETDEDVNDLLDTPVQYSTPEERPIQKVQPIQAKTPDEIIADDIKELRALLRRKIPEVKKVAQDMRPARLKRLLELERETKARKGIMIFLNDLLALHESTVAARVGQDDVGGKHQIDLHAVSTQVSDIVESEEEEVTIELE